ncbi:hypothetical protein BDY21DRAFT_410191 [Lineolata rhizophorae]|uniref:Uncharacterized protein n=1 Tax=Lineolata rhizophorae TaxID=578093 RepID=A0A6A6P580_9PEZI|nr:hypothetical protein BDY21DRAFT_410191 [Lineolata rhizophorae]
MFTAIKIKKYEQDMESTSDMTDYTAMKVDAAAPGSTGLPASAAASGFAAAAGNAEALAPAGTVEPRATVGGGDLPGNSTGASGTTPTAGPFGSSFAGTDAYHGNGSDAAYDNQGAGYQHHGAAYQSQGACRDDNNPVQTGSGVPLQFNNAVEALAARETIHGPPYSMPSDHIRRLLVKGLADSMINLTEVQDTDAKVRERFGPDGHDRTDIEIAAWALLDRVERFHSAEGIPAPFCYGKAKDKSVMAQVKDRDMSLDLPTRVVALCELFRAWKSAVVNLLDGHHVDVIITGPKLIKGRKEANLKANRTKHDMIKRGRSAMANNKDTNANDAGNSEKTDRGDNNETGQTNNSNTVGGAENDENTDYGSGYGFDGKAFGAMNFQA